MDKIRVLARLYYIPLIFLISGLGLIILSTFLSLDGLFVGPKIGTEYVLADVGGEVINPGVYKFIKGVTVGEAIRIAGGLTNQADNSYINRNLNLAKTVAEGQKIYIPKLGELSSSTSSKLTNINTATKEQLEALPAVGAVSAQKILDSRPYSSIEELLNKKVLSKSSFEKVKELIEAN